MQLLPANVLARSTGPERATFLLQQCFLVSVQDVRKRILTLYPQNSNSGTYFFSSSPPYRDPFLMWPRFWMRRSLGKPRPRCGKITLEERTYNTTIATLAYIIDYEN